MRTGLIAAIALALAVPCASLAQTPAAPTPAATTPAPADGDTALSGVTITAQRKPREAVDPQATYPSVVDKFIQSQLQDGPSGNLGRWRAPVCPTVEGLTPEFNAFIYRRLVAVAQEVGAPKPRSSDCKHTNVLVVFTTEPAKFMGDIATNHPGMFDAYYAVDAMKEAEFVPPITMVMKIATTSGGVTDGRFRNGIETKFLAAVVVADPSLLEDQPIGRVADNIIGRVLGGPPDRRGGCAALPSVLDALDPACPASDTVEEMTVYDKVALTGLYHTDPNLVVGFERGAILHQLLRETRPPGG